MEINLFAKAIDDFKFWQKSGDKSIQKKIEALLKDIQSHPYTGIGKPEALKHQLSGQWSRRINGEHRMIYDVEGDVINIYSLKGHYQ